MEPKDWKSEFLRLAGEHEEGQLERQETEKLLCRTIIRLTLATSGLDPNLDPYLSGLRDAVRNGVQPQSRERLVELSESLLHAEDEAASVHSPSRSLFQRLLSQPALKGQAGKRLEQLAREFQAAPDAVTDRQLDDLLDLIVEARGDEKSGGFWGRLRFGNGDKGHARPNEMLLDLLDSLSWPGHFREDVALLTRQLITCRSGDSWVDVIRRLLDMILEVMGGIQQEILATEGFLEELTSRLQEIDDHVTENHDLREASLDSTQRLTQTVHQQVGGIRQGMMSADGLQQLRDEVNERINIIETHMDSHLEDEQERRQKAEHNERMLQERLSEVEEESRDLRKKLSEAHQRATTDTLTGLPNRLAYEERLQQEYARWKRFAEPLSLLVWDVDDFKRVNDRFGHHSGDKTLKVIGRTLQESLRETDFVARFGGEEFVMLLPGASAQEAAVFAEKVRGKVQDSGFHSGGSEVQVSISCGLTEFREGDLPVDAFQRADGALYEAKRKGKNRCVIG
jgi:diguanylate cyclase